MSKIKQAKPLLIMRMYVNKNYQHYWDKLTTLINYGRIIVILLASICVQFTHGATTNVHPRNPFIDRGPYLQLATPNSIFVVWRAETNIQPSVHFGSSPARLDHITKTNDIIVRYATTNRFLPVRGIGRLHSAPEGTWQFEARISGLRPDTEYYYAVYDGEHRLTEEDESYHFRTNPIKGARRPMR